MRLLLHAPDRRPYWLVGNPARNERAVTEGKAADSQILEINWQITRNQQVVAGAEWQARMVFDRGNAGLAFDVSNYRCFDDLQDLILFIARECTVEADYEKHKWEGYVWLRTQVNTAGLYNEYLITGATISIGGIKQTGLALQITYRIQAQGFDPHATESPYPDGVRSGYETCYPIDANGARLVDASGRRIMGDMLYRPSFFP